MNSKLETTRADERECIEAAFYGYFAVAGINGSVLKKQWADILAVALKMPREKRRHLLRWGVTYKDVLIAAFAVKPRAEQFLALGERDNPPGTVKLVDLFA